MGYNPLALCSVSTSTQGWAMVTQSHTGEQRTRSQGVSDESWDPSSEEESSNNDRKEGNADLETSLHDADEVENVENVP